MIWRHHASHQIYKRSSSQTGWTLYSRLNAKTPGEVVYLWASRRSLTQSAQKRATVVTSATTAQSSAHPTDAPTTNDAPPLVQPSNPRKYLREWSEQHHKRLAQMADTAPVQSRTTSIATSMFVKDKTTSTTEEEKMNNDIWNQAQEDLAHEDGESTTSTSTAMYMLQPGDAVRINHRFAKNKLAIFIRRIGMQCQYLLEDGRWLLTPKFSWKSYCIQSLITAEEVAALANVLPSRLFVNDIGNPIEVQGNTPPNTTLVAQQKFAVLFREIESAKRDLITVADDIYAAIALDTECAFASAEDVFEHTYGHSWSALTEGAKMVISEKMFDDDRFATIIQGTRWGFLALPRIFVDARARVRDWSRDYQDAAARAAAGHEFAQQLARNPLTKFIHKARRLISQSRKFRKPDAKGLLSSTFPEHVPQSGKVERRPTGEQFDEDEQLIIKFLFSTYILTPFANTSSNMRNAACGSLILRAVGAYPDFELSHMTARTMLTEMGCLDPWCSSATYNVQAPLPRLGLHKEMDVLTAEVDNTIAELDFSNGQIPFTDSMAHIRKDWGNLEVFLIDSAATGTVDDGISVEPCASNPSATWIHVHTAHPSAYLPLDSPFIRLAQISKESHYDWKGPVPMLPWEVSRALSVKSGASVLTLSTLLDNNDGSVLDVKVRAARVHNTIKMTPVELKVLVGASSNKFYTLKVGANHPFDGSKRDAETWKNLLEPEKAQAFRNTFLHLMDLQRKRAAARRRERPNFLNLYRSILMPSNSYRVDFDPYETRGDQHWQRVLRSEHVFGDPTIVVTDYVRGEDYWSMRTLDHTEKYLDDPVMACMQLAKESVASWTAAHDIPALYQYQTTINGTDIDSLNNLGKNDSFFAPRSGWSINPRPYLTQNMAQSFGFTSPLRDWSHMRMAYQIDAYLKAEAATIATGSGTGSGTGAPPEDGATQANVPAAAIQYPYSRQMLLDSITDCVQSHGMDRRTSAFLEALHWRLVALYRAFHCGEAQLPSVWDLFILNDAMGHYDVKYGGAQVRGTLTGIGITANILPSEEGWERKAKFRQFLPCKLQAIHPHTLVVDVVAVGPACDLPQHSTYPELL